MKNKDDRQKALCLFNFAGLDKKQLGVIKAEMEKIYPQHKVFMDGKEWKKNMYKYNFFVCTIEPTYGGGANVLTYVKSMGKYRIVLCIEKEKLSL